MLLDQLKELNMAVRETGDRATALEKAGHDAAAWHLLNGQATVIWVVAEASLRRILRSNYEASSQAET